MGVTQGYNGYETPTFVNNYPPMVYGQRDDKCHP